MNTLKPTGVGRTPHKVIQMLRTPGVHHTASASPQLLARSLHQACRGNRVCGGPFHTLAPQWSAVPECVLQQAKRQWVPDVCFGQDNVPGVGQLAPGVCKMDRAGWGFRGSDGGERASRPPVVGRAMQGSGERTLEDKQAWCRSGLHCPAGLRKPSSAGGHPLVPLPWGAQTKEKIAI